MHAMMPIVPTRSIKLFVVLLSSFSHFANSISKLLIFPNTFYGLFTRWMWLDLRQHVGRLYRLETSPRCKCWKDLALRICCRWDDGSEGTSLRWPLIVFHLKGPPGCILAQLEGQMRPGFRAGWCKVSGFYKAPYINLITVGFSIFLRCLSRDGHSFSQKDAFYGAAARWRAASVCSADFNCLSVAVKVSVKYTTVKRAAGPEPSASWETEMN